MEYKLQKAFVNRALNLINFREFFNVTLEVVEEKIKELGFKTEFTKEPEAMEYKETLAIKEKDLRIELPEEVAAEFPESLL